jgi:hypothetical protein
MVPFGGAAVAAVLVAGDVRRKGLVGGLVNSGLDAIPFVGLGKNLIELFAGDLIPDRQRSAEAMPPREAALARSE